MVREDLPGGGVHADRVAGRAHGRSHDRRLRPGRLSGRSDHLGPHGLHRRSGRPDTHLLDGRARSRRPCGHDRLSHRRRWRWSGLRALLLRLHLLSPLLLLLLLALLLLLLLALLLALLFLLLLALLLALLLLLLLALLLLLLLALLLALLFLLLLALLLALLFLLLLALLLLLLALDARSVPRSRWTVRPRRSGHGRTDSRRKR